MGRNATKVTSYFNSQELGLIQFVANDLLNVDIRKFVKGAAIELANASLKMAQEIEDAKDQPVQGADAEDRGEQSSSEGGEGDTSQGSVGESQGDT